MAQKDKIQKIVLPDTLIKINDSAFYSTNTSNFNYIEIPNGVKSIGAYAFANIHYKLLGNTVTIPNSVEEIGDYAFANIHGTNFEYNVETGLTQHSGFKYDVFPNGMFKLELGTGLKNIGKYAFLNQPYLKTVNIPSNIIQINEGAFLGTNIETLNIEERTADLNIGKYAFADTLLKSEIIIKNNYKMEEYVFANCKLIPSIKFEDGITKIPDGILYGAMDLTQVIKPNTINEIGYDAFSLCSSITNDEYNNILSNVTIIGNGAFSGCTKLNGTIEVPNIVTSMGTYVFEDCCNIEKVIMNLNINEVPDGTFKNCTNLLDVTKPVNATRIGNEAFYNCEKINTEEYYDITEKITVIGNYAFSGCVELTGLIEVKEIVTQLGEYVFSRCSNITESKIIPEYTKLPNGTYDGCTNLSNITIPDSIVEIGDDAFRKCTKINMEEYKDISRNSISIGNSAFENCTLLEGTLNIKNIVTYIGDAAFRNCSNITKIEFEPSTTKMAKTIGKQCFYKTAEEQEIVKIYSQNTRIKQKAFTNIREFFIYDLERNVDKEYKWYGDANSEPIVHYDDCTHSIDITCTLPGVSLVDPATGEVLTSKDWECETDFSFKLVIEEGFEEKYSELAIKVISEGKYSNSELSEEWLEVENNKIYTFDNVIRNKKIIVQATKNGTDLVLRQFISKKNEIEIGESRYPDVKLERNKVDYFSYNHTKYPLVAKKGDKITYTIRVYNEGDVVGKVNEIKVNLPEELTFVEADSINSFYEWTVSEDGKTITTKYLEGKEIESFPGSGKPSYNELEYVCELNLDSVEDVYLATVAEIASGNDIDSLASSMKDIDLHTYMKEDSYLSSRDIYTKGEEDDTDIEAIIYKGIGASAEITLVINKIDSLSNELLNGAKIQLLNDKKEIIDVDETTDGTINFGEISVYGEGIDTYYLNEIETPAGYKRTMEGMIELQIVKTLNDNGELDVNIIYEVQDIDGDESVDFETDENLEFIPISTQEQLAKIGSNENIEVNGKTYSFTKKANYELKNNIQLTGEWVPIENMNGIFEGNNFNITGLNVNGDNSNILEVGLFRTFSGEIRNLNVTGNITGASNTTEKNSIYNEPATGGIVGYMEYGTIKNCTFNGNVSSVLQNVGGIVGHTKSGETVKFEKSVVKGSVKGIYNVGGLVGNANSNVIIISCSNENTVISATDSGYYNFGGFVGSANGGLTVENTTNKATYEQNQVIICSNLGGIVGYISQNTTAVLEDCHNIVNITGQNNIGGLVGYCESVINISNSSNSGTIEAKMYNAGGIIGKSSPIGSANANTIIDYDKENRCINVYIKNKETEGSYKLNILKVDLSLEKGKEGLAGAKFNVYDSNMNPIKENAEVNADGVLFVDEISINSLTSDVYFIKEVEAPEGYDILIKDFVQVEVKKEWDSENERYIISQKYKLIEELEKVEVEEDNTKTGSNTPDITYSNVRYKSSKTGIINCTNSGNVLASSNNSKSSNAGGIAGVIVGFSIIEECENTAYKIESKKHSGGIVAELMMLELGDEAVVRKCTNGAAVTGETSSGIVGISSIFLEIDTCNNSGVISNNSSSELSSVSAGILAAARSNTIINECINIGNIGNKNAYASGGIVGNDIAYQYYLVDNSGNSSYYKYNVEKIEINNCDVKSCVISGNSNVAAIMGASFSQNCLIENCEVNNVVANCSENNSSYKSASGILGHFSGEELKVDNCDVVNSTITTKSGNVAGIIASTYEEFIYAGDWCDVEYNKIQITNCDVLGTVISTTGGDSVAGGIFGNLGIKENPEMNSELTILDCNVGNGENNKTTVIQGVSHAAGVFAGTHCWSMTGTVSITIGRCNVENATIVSKGIADRYNNTYNGVSGIISYINTSSANINVFDCIVKNDQLINNSCNDSSHIGGILSSYYPMGDNQALNINNCKVLDTTMNSNGVQVGGIMCNIWGNTFPIQIENCMVSNCTINYPSKDYMIANGERICTAGVVAMVNASGELTLKDTVVEGIDINNAGLNVGGFIGSITNQSNIKVNIIDSKLIAKIDEETKEKRKNTITLSSGTKAAGGVLGTSNGGNINISNFECSDIVFDNTELMRIYQDSDIGISIGGIIGDSGGVLEAENINVSNIESNIKVDQNSKNMYGNYYKGVLGGFAGLLWNTNSNIRDITISNINMKTNAGDVATFISNCWKGTEWKDITIDNCDVIVDGGNVNNNASGFVALITYGGGSGPEIKNIKISNTNISALNNKLDSYVAGILCENKLEDINISGVELNNIEMNGTMSEDSSSQKIHMGGFISVSDFIDLNISDSEINGIKITNDSEEGIIGGVVGVGVVNAKEGHQSSKPYGSTVNIKNTNVKNIIATGKYAIGGILGTGIGIIDSCSVENPILTATSKNATVGGAVGIAVEGSDIKNVTVTANVSETAIQDIDGEAEAKQYGVFSDYLSGGIIAINSGKLSNSKVENIIVKTLVKLVESIENPKEGDEVELSTSIKESTTPCASEVQVQCLEDFENCTYDNVTVIHGEE